jgi:hypothetical protein
MIGLVRLPIRDSKNRTPCDVAGYVARGPRDCDAGSSKVLAILGSKEVAGYVDAATRDCDVGSSKLLAKLSSKEDKRIGRIDAETQTSTRIPYLASEIFTQ